MEGNTQKQWRSGEEKVRNSFCAAALQTATQAKDPLWKLYFQKEAEEHDKQQETERDGLLPQYQDQEDVYYSRSLSFTLPPPISFFHFSPRSSSSIGGRISELKWWSTQRPRGRNIHKKIFFAVKGGTVIYVLGMLLQIRTMWCMSLVWRNDWSRT